MLTTRWACREGRDHTAAMLLDAGAAVYSDAQGEQVREREGERRREEGEAGGQAGRQEGRKAGRGSGRDRDRDVYRETREFDSGPPLSLRPSYLSLAGAKHSSLIHPDLSQVLSAAVSAGHDAVVQLLLERAPPPAAPLGARAATAHPGGADFATTASRSPASTPRASKPATSRSPERARGGSKPAKAAAAAGAATTKAAAAAAATSPPPRHGWVPVEVIEAMLRDAEGHGFDDIAEALRRHLDARDSAAAAAAHERAALVKRQARVRLHGLQGKPELNGRVGHVKAFHAASGRFELDLQGEEVVQVRPACVTALGEGGEYLGSGGQQRLEAAAAAAVAELTEASEAAAAPLPYVALGMQLCVKAATLCDEAATLCGEAAPLCD